MQDIRCDLFRRTHGFVLISTTQADTVGENVRACQIAAADAF